MDDAQEDDKIHKKSPSHAKFHGPDLENNEEANPEQASKRPRRAPSLVSTQPQNCTSWVKAIVDAFDGLWNIKVTKALSVDTVCSGFGTPMLALEVVGAAKQH